MEKLNASDAPLYGGYRWAFGIEDVVRTIGYKGPVVLGIDWHESMYYPDANGFISPTEHPIGGHAILAKGVKLVPYAADAVYGIGNFSNVDLDKSYVRLHNSWGRDYGKGGDAFMTLRDLDRLLRAGGDACVPTLRRS